MDIILTGAAVTLTIFTLSNLGLLIWQMATLNARSLEARSDRGHAREERQRIEAALRLVDNKLDDHVLFHNGGRGRS
jgi:hypothetical protein